ncbi:MAG: glycine--tRNA ligase subunit beta [Firmicutes bacterium]|nr:glycine--tRNA ligase subunit beta [Bacillota bacterium]
MAKDLLFEIGIEEIPARFMEPALNQLKTIMTESLAEAGLQYEKLATYGTPRRITLLINGLDEVQPDRRTESKGPAVKAAYGADGQPSKALLGFCRGQGIEPADVLTKEIKGVEYVYAVKQIAGRPTAELLPEMLSAAVHKIYFPKPMRWAYNEMRFARPIRWLVLLFGADVLPLEIAGVAAGRISRGHRFLGSDSVEIACPAEYLDTMQKAYVIVDQSVRREKIWQQIKAVASVAGGTVKPDEDLLSELVYILEYPTALLGRFDKKYLEIPEELVVTPMREHQRYFPVYDAAGEKLLPNFITVRNGNSQHLEIVAAGNEKVLSARLADAAFFWDEDRSHALIDNAPRLEHIVFHEKLGTLSAKVARVQKLALSIAEKLGYAAEDVRDTERAALLMKCDLVSNAVYEFTELQGIMGEYYAKNDGETEQVAAAIREHYLPRFTGDELPKTKAGVALALADRLDSLAGFFSQKMIPTGSQDPYALRRAAIGVSQILLRYELELDLAELCAEALALYEGVKQEMTAEETLAAMNNFFRQRVDNILAEEGVTYDVINAVAGLELAVPLVNYRKAHALADFKQGEDFVQLMAGYNRAANLLKNVKGEFAVDAALFEVDAERELMAAEDEAAAKVAAAVAAQNYPAALKALAAIRPQIDAFFEAVMVMADDAKVRDNRLALLQKLVGLTAELGELSQLVAKA